MVVVISYSWNIVPQMNTSQQSSSKMRLGRSMSTTLKEMALIMIKTDLLLIHITLWLSNINDTYLTDPPFAAHISLYSISIDITPRKGVKPLLL